jgi:RNA polymerase sigma factor (sigma-70 family)
MLPAAKGEELFMSCLDVIEEVIAVTCRCRRMNVHERDDFASHVKFKLIDNDYGVLAKFHGRCNIKTYLVVVVHRMLIDFWIARRGKWRPSAQARRLGPVAVRMEGLLYREGYSIDECCEILKTNHGVKLSTEELVRIAGGLRPRAAYQREADEIPDDIAAESPTGEETLLLREDMMAQDEAVTTLRSALDRLSPENRLLLRLKFEGNLTVPRIAATLQIDEKHLYRRIEKLLKQLRSELELRGVEREQVSKFFAREKNGPFETTVPQDF